MSGCIASTITWTCLYPIDMLKTSIQSYNNNNIENIKNIIHQRNYLRLWKGLPAALLKVAPVNGCIMISYETVRYFINKNKI